MISRADREAEVDDILTGRSPLDNKLPLFPAKATHQQLLGLVQRPSHPDKPAPKVPKERKWLGDNVGWEGKPKAGRLEKEKNLREATCRFPKATHAAPRFVKPQTFFSVQNTSIPHFEGWRGVPYVLFVNVAHASRMPRGR